MNEPRLIYEALDPIEPEDAETALGSDDADTVGRALLRLALHGPDWELAERRAVDLSGHPAMWVRRNAATSLGHIARLTGRLHPGSVSTLHRLQSDPEVSGWAESSLQDAKMFVEIPRVPVDSTALASVGYDPGLSVLDIEFEDGSIYRYDAVPAEVHDALLTAESLGAYFNSHIKPVYDFREIGA
jgi:hypothetical protein